MTTKSYARPAVLIVQLSMLLSGSHASEKEFGEIKVRVIDQVGVPEKEWRLAEQAADRVFRTARVSLIWVRCLWNPSTGDNDCLQGTAANEITLVVVSEQSGVRLQASPVVFGAAVTLPNGSFASRGYIFYSRIQTKCAEHHDIREALLLGAVVAHELGHLLLGPNSHSANGIMKPDLERADITGINLSALEFNSGQRETLRNAVARRLEAAHSKGINPNSSMAQATAPSAAR